MYKYFTIALTLVASLLGYASEDLSLESSFSENTSNLTACTNCGCQQKKVELVLYYKPSCPYCVKVLRALNDMHKQPPTLKDVSQASNLKELVQIGGKRQVPCLVIDGQAMYESDHIIRWIKAHPEDFADIR